MDARSAVFAGITALLLQSGLPSNAQTAPPIKDPPCIAEMDLANFINGYNGNHAMLADQARAWTRIGRSLNIPSQLQRGQCINEYLKTIDERIGEKIPPATYEPKKE